MPALIRLDRRSGLVFVYDLKNLEYHQRLNSENQHRKQECGKYLLLNKDKEKIEISELK